MAQSTLLLSARDRREPGQPRLVDARVVLVIDAPGAMQFVAPALNRQAVVLTQMRMFGQSMLETVRPDAVVGPLITDNWDIVDLALQLDELGFRGDLFAVTRPLPRAELVIREVGAVCPRLRVHLLETA